MRSKGQVVNEDGRDVSDTSLRAEREISKKLSACEEAREEETGDGREGRKERVELTFATNWFGPSSSEEDDIATETRKGESRLESRGVGSSTGAR